MANYCQYMPTTCLRTSWSEFMDEDFKINLIIVWKYLIINLLTYEIPAQLFFILVKFEIDVVEAELFVLRKIEIVSVVAELEVRQDALIKLF